MDSSGPWASYTYNGLPASQAPPPGSSAGQRTVADLQAMGTPPAAAASQLLLAGMSPAAVAVAANSSFQLGNYDSSVFSQLFHHQKNVAQHRSHQAMSQAGQMEQSSPWTPQTNSLGNPFGVLPHQASQKTNSPNKGENTFSAHIIPPFAHSASNYSNAQAGPNLPFVPQKTAPKVPIFTPKAPPKHKNPPTAPEQPVGRYNNNVAPSNLTAAAAVAAASAVINNSKPSNIIVHRSFPPHLQPHCRSYPSPDSDYQQQRNTPDSVSSATYGGDSDCHMPSPNPSSPYYNMASPDSCVYSKPSHFQEVDGNKRVQQQQQQQQQQSQQQFPMKPSHNSWDEKRAAAAAAAAAAVNARYNNYPSSDSSNNFPVSDQQQQQHYQAHSTINLADLHGGGEELLGGSDSEDYERKRQRRIKRARKSDSPEKINRQLTLLQPVHAEDGYAASALGFHSRVAFPPLPNNQSQVPGHQQPQHHHLQQQQQQLHHHQQHQQQQQNHYPPPPTQPVPQQSKESKVSSIDAELGFLEMSNANRAAHNNQHTLKLKKDGPGFMDSYIKFINGDNDPSTSNPMHRSGRKTPPKQRSRNLPQAKAAAVPCPPEAVVSHMQHQQNYQIHQQQLDPAGLREEPEPAGRGRKRSLAQHEGHAAEGQLEGLSIEGCDEARMVGSESCSEAGDSGEDVDFSEIKFQPRVIISRISPDTLRRYSQTDSESEETPAGTSSGGFESEESSSCAALNLAGIANYTQPTDNTAQRLHNRAAGWDERTKTLSNVVIQVPNDLAVPITLEETTGVISNESLLSEDLHPQAKENHTNKSPHIPNISSSKDNMPDNMMEIFPIIPTTIAKINFEAPSACQKNLGAHSTNSREYDSLDLSADDSRVIHKDGFVLVDLRKNSSILKVPKIPTGNNDATIQSLQAAGSESLLVQALSTPTLIEPTVKSENFESLSMDHFAEKKIKAENEVSLDSGRSIPHPNIQMTQVAEVCKTEQESENNINYADAVIKSSDDFLEASQYSTQTIVDYDMLAIMIENDISVDGASARTTTLPKDHSQDVIQQASPNPQMALSLYQTLTEDPPPPASSLSVEDELGHLFGHLPEMNPISGDQKRKVEQKRPTPQSVSKKLWCELNDSEPIASTGLKKSCPSSKSGPKSTKLQKPNESSIPEDVKEFDLMPEMNINQLRRRYKAQTFIQHVTNKNEDGHLKVYRIDGPSVMQVFAPYFDGDVLLYKSMPSHTEWDRTKYREYRILECEIFKSTQDETIARPILPGSPKKCPRAERKRFMYALDDTVDDFRTYVQALLSQAVDAGFLQVVINEQVNYFVDALGRIDDINAKKVEKLQDSYQFPDRILKMLDRWPKYKALPLNVAKKCECCKVKNAVYLMDAVGNPYCKKTLCPLNLKPFADLAREFISCKVCQKKVMQFCNTIHLKIKCYQACHQELQKYDELDRISNIINVCHSDWFDDLFNDLKGLWAVADCVESNSTSRNS